MDNRLMQWLLSDDTGLSSMAIVARMEGVLGRSDFPRDASDLGRCIRLLALMPEWKPRIHEMRDVHPVWAKIVERWDDLIGLYASGEDYDCYELLKWCSADWYKEQSEMFKVRRAGGS
jgi:hypothetical protein